MSLTSASGCSESRASNAALTDATAVAFAPARSMTVDRSSRPSASSSTTRMWRPSRRSGRRAAVSSLGVVLPLADDATEIDGERGHVDAERAFTLVPDEPTAPEPSHRHRDVRAAHARHLGQLVVADGQGDGVPFAVGGAEFAETKHQATEALLRPAMPQHLDTLHGVREPQAEGVQQRLERLAVPTKVSQEMTQLDLDCFTRGQGGGRRLPLPCSSGAQAQFAEGLARLDGAQEDGPILGRRGRDRHSPSSQEIDTVGRVVRLPYGRALRVTSDSSQRPIVRQMSQRDAGQPLAVVMLWKLWSVHARISKASFLRKIGAARGLPSWAAAPTRIYMVGRRLQVRPRTSPTFSRCADI